MNFNEYISIQKLVKGEEFPSIISSSYWTCGYSKKAIPEGCIEVTKGETVPFEQNSLISQKEIENYFIKFPRRKKIVVFVQNNLFLKSLEKKKWDITTTRVKEYTEYLFHSLNDEELTKSFLKSTQKILSFKPYRLFGEYGIRELANNCENSEDFNFDNSPFKISTIKVDNNKRLLVKDFTTFNNCIIKKDFENAKLLISKTNFVEKFISHKSFDKFIKILNTLEIIDLESTSELIYDKIPFITKNYNLFKEVFSFNPFNYSYSSDNFSVRMSDCLLTMLKLLKEEDKKTFFTIYFNYIGINDIKIEKISNNFFNLYSEFSLLATNNTRIKMNDNPIKLSNTNNVVIENNTSSNYIIGINPNTFNLEVQPELRVLDFQNIEFRSFNISNNNITYLSIDDIYIENGILDLSKFDKIKSLSITGSNNIKKIIFNDNITFLNFRGCEKIVPLLNQEDFDYLSINNVEVVISDKIQTVIDFFSNKNIKDFDLAELSLYTMFEDNTQDILDKSFEILGEDKNNYEMSALNHIKYFSIEDILKVIN